MEAIKRIHIPLIPILDRLVWILDPKGKFSVQSAFKNSLPSLTIIPKTPWTKIWKLNVHERYKMLLWRIGSNILPINKNFVLRVGSGDPTCPLCHLEEESIVHLFFHYPIARAIWFGKNLGIISYSLHITTCSNIVNMVINPPFSTAVSSHWKELSATFAKRLILTLYCIWSFCNQLVHKEPKGNIFTSIQGLENRILEHYAKNVKVLEIVLHSARWCPPPECHIKLDTDAAVSLNSSTIVVVVARDLGGTFYLAWTKHTKVSNILCAEAAAILWAIQLAKLENLTHIVVESDSKICINSIKGHPEEVNWNVSAFLSVVIALASDFISCCFSWVKRDTNGTTHELARLAFPLNSYFSCNDVTSLPPSVKQAWQRDALCVC